MSAQETSVPVGEAELQARFDAGEFTPGEWRDFWWQWRADALSELRRMEVHRAKLEASVARATARIEAMTSAGVHP